MFEVAQLEGRKIQEEPQVSTQSTLARVQCESPEGNRALGLLQ